MSAQWPRAQPAPAPSAEVQARAQPAWNARRRPGQGRRHDFAPLSI